MGGLKESLHMASGREKGREREGDEGSEGGKLKCKQFFNYAIHLKGFATKT